MALRAAVVLVVLLWVGVAAVAAARANVRARADERRLAPAYMCVRLPRPCWVVCALLTGVRACVRVRSEREGRVAQMPLTMDADQAPVPIDGAVHPFMALATLPYQQAYFDVRGSPPCPALCAVARSDVVSQQVLNRAVTPPVVNSLPPAAPTFAVGCAPFCSLCNTALGHAGVVPCRLPRRKPLTLLCHCRQSVNPFRPGSPFYSPARGTSFGPNAVYASLFIYWL